jgi:hypothetical protein
MVEISEFRREKFRERLRGMSDEKLLQYGKAAAYMANSRNSADKRRAHEVYKIQLEECRLEWRRRHPPRVDDKNKPGVVYFDSTGRPIGFFLIASTATLAPNAKIIPVLRSTTSFFFVVGFVFGA